jgi:predicted secreted protein
MEKQKIFIVVVSESDAHTFNVVATSYSDAEKKIKEFYKKEYDWVDFIIDSITLDNKSFIP